MRLFRSSYLVVPVRVFDSRLRAFHSKIRKSESMEIFISIFSCKIAEIINSFLQSSIEVDVVISRIEKNPRTSRG
jgi:predicted transcriptional regulator